MNHEESISVRPFGRAVAAHSLGWLVAANLVGVWLGVSLLWPKVGNSLAPFTYGRWTPLHLDWQLYGWCALPIVGALLSWFFDLCHPRVNGHARLALVAWSIALALGGIAWLGGTTSGKLFLDWYGWARPWLPIAMQLLWVLLAVHTWRRWRTFPVPDRILRGMVLTLLIAVPSILYWSTARAVYQPINPDSGGATGASLLGSTLGIVTICFLLPRFLGIPTRSRTGGFIAALFGSWLVFAAIDRGSVSHHVPAQIVALGTLLAWIPLLPLYWRRHEWPAGTRPWLIAISVWWAVLVSTGWISYLPHVSEALKFTHALVGHAHLAMAGFLTSVNGLILITLTGKIPPRGAFWLWQTGCAVYVVAMLVLGCVEVDHLAELFRSEGWTQMLLAARLAGGLAMTAASVFWLRTFVRS